MLNNLKFRSKPLFTVRKHQPINTYKIGFNLSSINTKVISCTPIHLARHSFAVNILNGGADIKTVSSLLGHASLKMTEKYLHVVDSRKQSAIDSLGEIAI